VAPRFQYPWNKYLDGQWHLLVKGEDFHVDIEHFRSAVLREASSRKKQVETSRFGDSELLVRSHDQTEPILRTPRIKLQKVVEQKRAKNSKPTRRPRTRAARRN
jgi:hypothetical protein